MTRRQVNIFINGQQVENTLKNIYDEKRRINRELNHMVVGSDAYNKKARELKDINNLLDTHRKKIGQTGDTLGKITGGLTKFAGVAGIAFGVSEVVQYGKKLFELGAEMELLGKKALTVFGQALPAVTRAAEENATAMGLTTSQYIDQAAAIGDLLIPMGFQREEAANLSTNLVNLSGALSEWTGGQVTAEQVSKTLSKAMLGEREELKQLGISIQEADVKARLQEKGLDKLTGTLLQQAKAIATVELITEKSTDAQAAYAANSETMVRRQAELTAKFSELQEKLATALVPVFERLLSLAERFTDGLAFLGRGLDAISSSNNQAAESAQRMQTEFNAEIEVLKQGNISQENRARLIDEINKKYKDYLPDLITEQSTIEQITEAQNAANDAFGRRIVLLAAEEQLVSIQKQLLAAKREELDLAVALEKSLQAGEARGVNRGNARQQARRGTSGDEQSAVNENIALQQQLQEELSKTQQAAIEAGVDIQAMFGSPTDTEGGDTIADRLGAGAGAGDEVNKNLEKVAEAIRLFQENQRLESLTEAERELEEIRIKYQKQIDLATELERAGFTQATAQRQELEALRGQELEAAKLARDAARRERELALEEEQLVEDLERNRVNEERRQQLEDEINAKVREVVLSERELAIVELDEQYNALIAQAQLYGIDTYELELARRKELEGINKEFNSKELKADEAQQKARIAASEAAYRAMGDAVSTFYNDVLNEQERATGAGKLLALINIGISSASALAKSAEAAAGVPFPGNLAAIASSVATVLSIIGQARQALNATPDVAQRKDGSFFTVTGEDDGRSYRAKHIGSPKTGKLPNYPVLIDSITGSPVLGSERGAEYFVAHHDLQNPAVFRHVSAIEAITRQRADGGFSTSDRSAPASAPTSGNSEGGTGMDAALVAQLGNSLTRLVNVLERGIPAIIGDDAILDFNDRFDELNAASGGVLR